MKKCVCVFIGILAVLMAACGQTPADIPNDVDAIVEPAIVSDSCTDANNDLDGTQQHNAMSAGDEIQPLEIISSDGMIMRIPRELQQSLLHTIETGRLQQSDNLLMIGDYLLYAEISQANTANGPANRAEIKFFDVVGKTHGSLLVMPDRIIGGLYLHETNLRFVTVSPNASPFVGTRTCHLYIYNIPAQTLQLAGSFSIADTEDVQILWHSGGFYLYQYNNAQATEYTLWSVAANGDRVMIDERIRAHCFSDNRIYFASGSDNHFYSSDLDGSSCELLYAYEGSIFQMTAHATSLYYSVVEPSSEPDSFTGVSHSTLYSLDLDTGETASLYQAPGAYIQGNIVFCPDGMYVPISGGTPSTQVLFLSDNGAVQPFLEGPVTDMIIAEDTVYYMTSGHSQNSVSDGTAVWKIRRDGSGQEQIDG